MGKSQRAVCSRGLVVLVEAAVWLQLGFESEQGSRSYRYVPPSQVCVCLRMANTERVEGYWCAIIRCSICTESWQPDSEEGEVCRNERPVQQTNPTSKIFPTLAAVPSMHHCH